MSSAGVAPAGFHPLLFHPLQGQPDGGAAVQQFLGDDLPDAVIQADHGICQSCRQGLGQGSRDRGHQVNPVGTEPGGEHRQRDDQAPGEVRLLGIDIHQLPVGHHFRAADVEGLAPGFVMFQAAYQVGEDVA